MKNSALIVLIFFSHFFKAQKNDSIIAILRSQPHDSVKFICYDELCWRMLDFNADSAMNYAKLTYGLSQKLNQPEKTAIALNDISFTYYYKGNMDSAIAYALRAYELRKTFSDKTSATKSLNNLSVMYEETGELDKALGLLKDAEKNLRVNDYMKSSIKNNLGLLYKKKGNYREALKYYFEALSLKEKDKTGGLKDMAMTLANIAGVYKDIADLKKSREYLQKAYDLGMQTDDIVLKSQLMEQMGIQCRKEGDIRSALEYYKKALDLKRNYGNPSIISQSLVNIGVCYMAIKNYEEAALYMEEAIEIKRKQNDKGSLAVALNNYGSILQNLGKPQEGIKAVKEAVVLSTQIHEKENLVHSFSMLADIYEFTGDEKSALRYLRQTINLKDSLFTTANQTLMQEMDAKYQTEKKEKEIKLLGKDKDLAAKEIALRNSQRNAFIVGFVLMVLLSVLIFRSLQQNKQKNRIITEQKKEVELQKHLVEAHQKETLDSIHYAKRIQSALLAHKDLLGAFIPDNFIFFRPKDIVSGDFYWATEHNKKFYLAVCDSTGHGVPGAFMSLLSMGFLSEAIKEKDITSTGEILNYSRKRLIETISSDGQKDGFDGILVCLDPKANTLTYSAAYNCPLLISANAIVELNADKMPVGQGERTDSFISHMPGIKKGDMLYLYTDGYPDQFGGPKGKKFKYKSLNNLLLEIHQKPAAEQKEILVNTFENWKGSLEQVDDVCIIGIRF